MSLTAIGIACENIEDSLKFYELLGFNFEKLGKDHYEATTKLGLRIMLDSYRLLEEINPNWQRPVSPGITLCFEREEIDHVDDVTATLKNNGYEVIKEPWDAFWGQRYASVKDPNGNQVDIFANIK